MSLQSLLTCRCLSSVILCIPGESTDRNLEVRRSWLKTRTCSRENDSTSQVIRVGGLCPSSLGDFVGRRKVRNVDWRNISKNIARLSALFPFRPRALPSSVFASAVLRDFSPLARIYSPRDFSRANSRSETRKLYNIRSSEWSSKKKKKKVKASFDCLFRSAVCLFILNCQGIVFSWK